MSGLAYEEARRLRARLASSEDATEALKRRIAELEAKNDRLRHRADNPHVACSCALCAMRHERDRLDDLLREANEDGFGWKPRAEVAEAERDALAAQVDRVRAVLREIEYPNPDADQDCPEVSK